MGRWWAWFVLGGGLGCAGSDGRVVDSGTTDGPRGVPTGYTSLFPDTSDTAAPTDTGRPTGPGTTTELPPSEGDLFASPLSTTPPPWSSEVHPQSPGSRWADPTPPLPTNAWWLRLVLGDGEAPIHPLPYQVFADASGLHTSFTTPTADGYQVSVDFVEDLAFGAQGELGSRAVVDHDPLSVTLQWTAPGGATLTTPIVRGMPYVTAQYDGHVPVVRAGRPIVAVDGQGLPATVSGTRFELDLGDEIWVLYASTEITWSAGGDALVATGDFAGSLRIARRTPGSDGVLDAHAGRIPTGGRVSATVEDGVATLLFDWETRGTGDLLMMRLPHHAPVLTGLAEAGYALPTLRGEMVGVTGARWTMEEPLSPIGFRAPRPIAPERVGAVRAALQGDVGLGVPSQDPYFAGKELALLGRLALIADELGETDLASQYRTTLRGELEPWLDGTNGLPLVYDTTWGGVVWRPGLSDPQAGFGQAYYNDHHFHYGYHVYAAAAVAEGEPGWLDSWKDPVDHLVRDYANPSDADPHYAVARSKDWFAGHSWAAGLFDFDRNQESTSEAVNAYYAVALWGRVTGDPRLRDLGRLMMATEIRAAHTYWQIEDGSPIYPPPFASNHVVGILFDRRVIYDTFFGNRPEFIHGIQYLPFTPVTEELLRPSWMAQAYPVATSGIGEASEGWRGLTIMARGVFEPEAAWDEAQSLTGYDNGNSEANTLYWLATRP